MQVAGRGIRICKKFTTRNKSKRNLPVETGEDKEEQRPGERKLPPGRNAERDVMKKSRRTANKQETSHELRQIAIKRTGYAMTEKKNAGMQDKIR